MPKTYLHNCLVTNFLKKYKFVENSSKGPLACNLLGMAPPWPCGSHSTRKGYTDFTCPIGPSTPPCLPLTSAKGVVITTRPKWVRTKNGTRAQQVVKTRWSDASGSVDSFADDILINASEKKRR